MTAAEIARALKRTPAAKLIGLGLLEMRDGILYLTIAGQNAVWE
jgi:hypothetical protein